jgi:hypothetical protein
MRQAGCRFRCIVTVIRIAPSARILLVLFLQVGLERYSLYFPLR